MYFIRTLSTEKTLTIHVYHETRIMGSYHGTHIISPAPVLSRAALVDPA